MTWVLVPEGRLRVGKILCLARNYRAHAEEFDETVPPQPTYFIKPATSIIHDGGEVVAPEITSDLHAEAELAVVIGTAARRVSRDSALDHVLGYCVFLDITARDLQRQAVRDGLPWTLAKGMDTFSPISDVRPKEEVGDPHALEILLKVNGKTRQSASTAQMVHKVPDVIASISAHMTLERGDMIATGTPEGVPRIVPGDRLQAEVRGVGRLRVKVVAGP